MGRRRARAGGGQIADLGSGAERLGLGGEVASLELEALARARASSTSMTPAQSDVVSAGGDRWRRAADSPLQRERLRMAGFTEDAVGTCTGAGGGVGLGTSTPVGSSPLAAFSRRQ